MIEILNELVENNFTETKWKRKHITYGGNSLIGYFNENVIWLYPYYKVSIKIIEQIYKFEEKNILLVFGKYNSDDSFNLSHVNVDINGKRFKKLRSDIKYKILFNTIDYYNINKSEINEYPIIANILKIGNRDKIINEIL